MKMSHLFATALTTMALALPVSAQICDVLPLGTDTTEGTGSSSYPWNFGNSEGRIQYIYESGGFSTQSPIIINKVSFRANGSTAATWAGGTYGNMQISMSTCPVDYLAATNSFAGNHGTDLTQVYSGAVTVKPTPAGGSTSPQSEFYVEVTLQTPFLYDPTQGDLNIDFINAPSMWTGTSTSVDLANYDGTRVWTFGAHGPTASVVQPNLAHVVEVCYNPANGLYSNFKADVQSGNSPLTVNFTDTTFTSDPGGVTSWLWNFGDGNTSTAQNPTHTYAACGSYNVTLTTTDASNPTSTETKNDFITVDPVTADFSATPVDGGAPLIVNFTDASSNATSWLWEFGDGNTSTAQNPTHVYTVAGAYDVKLTASNACFSGAEEKAGYIKVRPNGQSCLSTLFQGGNGLTANDSGNMFDMEILNPAGLKFSGVEVNTRAATGTPVAVEIYVTPDTYVGKDADASQWVKVGEAAGPSGGGGATEITSLILNDPFFLTAGKYGVYVVQKNGGIHYTNGNGSNQSYADANLKLDLGIAKTLLFGGSTFNPRIWNGSLCYQPDTEAGHGPFGFGCPGTNTLVPQIDFSAQPVIGTSFTIDFSDMVNATTPLLLLIGIPQATPVDLTLIGMDNGCFLFVDPLLTLNLVNVNGSFSAPASIPNDPTLVGAIVTMQAGVEDPGANTLGVVASPGHYARIGN